MINKLKVAINNKVTNKIAKGDRKTFGVLTRECENVEITLDELAAVVNKGHPFCAQHLGSRKNENFKCSDVLAVDIDVGMSISDALANDFVKQNAGFVYSTPSHTAEHHRFRIVFQTERTITDPEEMTAAYQGLIRTFGGDQSCKDACRAFYGSKGSEPIMLGKVLSNDQLNRLIQLGREPASVSDNASTDGKKKRYPIVARRSGVLISPEHPVTRADGVTEAFRLVPFEASVHCPVHIDSNPSAFVVKSTGGNKGVYCHSCAATFWMQSSNCSDFDFYRAESLIRQMEYEQDPDSYYDEADAPAELFAQARAERTARTFNQKFLESSSIQIDPGVTFLSSEKGSGKSEVLARKVAEFRAMGYSVLLVGHRQTLLQSMAARLGLTCYFYLDDGEYKNNKPGPYYAICVDSMPKLLKPGRNKFDVVILDESEQIFGHLTGSTLKNKRRVCYMQLFHYLSAAKFVFVADADLGAITVEGVYQACGPNAQYGFYINDHKAGKYTEKEFQYYGSEFHLTQEMLSTIGAGGRHYIATNSITKAKELETAIRLVHGNTISVMLVTSETSPSTEVQDFVKSIKTEILNYDVVIATPTLGTGIDITFPDAAQHIDTVFGFFVSRVNTHFDVDQQLSRVRHPKAVKVWIASETFTFETEPDVILREAVLNGLLNDVLIGYRIDGIPSLDSTYLNVYAQVTSIGRASKNNVRQNLLRLRERNGWKLVYVEVDDQGAEVGKVVKGLAKDAVEERRIEDICTAAQLSTENYDLLRESLSPLTRAEDAAMQRYELENFYGENASADLLALDNKGTYRRQLGLLEIYLSPTSELVTRDFRDSELATIVTDRKKRTLKQLMLKALLTQAGLADEATPIKLDAVITSDDLGMFAQFCQENSSRLQDLLGMSVRQDVQKKPMMQLGILLGQIGLSLKAVREQKIAKKKVYFYSVDSDEWQTASRYLDHRKLRRGATLPRLGA